MIHLLRQAIGNLRNAMALGIVSALNDAGQAKVLNLSTGDGVNRADVEVMEPWGFSASPPSDGMIALVVAIGADPSNMVALPPGNPACRFGGLKVGEVVVYGADGSRFHVRQGGEVEIWGGASVTVHTKTAVINVPEGCTVNGNLTVDGNLSVTGTIS